MLASYHEHQDASFLQDIATIYPNSSEGTENHTTSVSAVQASYYMLDGLRSQKVLPVPELAGCRWEATEKGLLLYTQNSGISFSKISFSGRDGLPIDKLNCVVQARDGTIWVGGVQGAARLRHGKWRYFAGKRWLPTDCVNSITVDEQNRAWISTDAGLSSIESVRMTLTEKASHYEQITAARHNRDGFVTECLLTVSGETESFLYEASDNDGLWTALYLCAESFRWAVTQDEDARNLARRSMRALLDLVRYTGIQGFPARAMMRRYERAMQSEPLANWISSPVDPDVLYKGDTSSDELDGHYLAWYVYSALAADEAERKEIAETCRAVTNHLLDNNYTLVGQSGKRTSWGVWTPEVLNNDPNWLADRGLNSLEMLSHLRVAMHLCPSPRFENAYRELIEQHHYAVNTIRQKMLPPEADFNHSDDELAACAYYPLLQLEDRPELRALYLASLERTYQCLRPQRSPFHNVLYGALTGRVCDRDSSVEWLQEAPFDLRDWTMRNSQRIDITFSTELDRFGLRQLERPLPPSEIGVMKWNRNPYLADWEEEGMREMDGAFWLLPYWMGRYHKIF